MSWWSHWYDNIAYRLPSSTVTAAGADNPQFGVWVTPRTLALVLEILRFLVGARVEMDALVGVLLLLGLAIIAVRWHNRIHRGRAQYLPKMNHEFDFDDFEPLSSSR